MFSGTARGNIAYGRPDTSCDDVVETATLANAHDFIDNLPDGHQAETGERGIKLSGGQRQHLSVARAILKDAPILVLDEATSTVDAKAEHAVQQDLDRLMSGRTTLIIAHRLSTIADVDVIVTLRNGRVDDVGSPSELATSGGIYAQLLHMQATQSEAAIERLKQFELR